MIGVLRLALQPEVYEPLGGGIAGAEADVTGLEKENHTE